MLRDAVKHVFSNIGLAVLMGLTVHGTLLFLFTELSFSHWSALPFFLGFVWLAGRFQAAVRNERDANGKLLVPDVKSFIGNALLYIPFAIALGMLIFVGFLMVGMAAGSPLTGMIALSMLWSIVFLVPLYFAAHIFECDFQGSLKNSLVLIVRMPLPTILCIGIGIWSIQTAVPYEYFDIDQHWDRLVRYLIPLSAFLAPFAFAMALAYSRQPVTATQENAQENAGGVTLKDVDGNDVYIPDDQEYILVGDCYYPREHLEKIQFAATSPYVSRTPTQPAVIPPVSAPPAPSEPEKRQKKAEKPVSRKKEIKKRRKWGDERSRSHKARYSR